MGSLFQELKRRNVVRVSVAYLALVWVVLQVTELAVPALNLPESLNGIVFYLGLIGFPFALFFAWAFELTPEGLMKTEDVDKSTSVIHSTGRKLDFAIIGLLAIAVSWLAIDRFIGAGAIPSQANTASAPIDKSIAVLPFTAFSSDPDEQFFADGLADTLLHKLAQLDDIRVISRTSSFQYRGDSVDVRQVGEELEVATVLEGSVQRNNDQLRIIAQLVNTEDGGHIWSQTFDRSSDDIFAIHDEISAAVVESLQLSMSPEEEERFIDRGTASVEAFNLLTLVSERSSETPLFELNSSEFQQRQYFWLNELDRVMEIDPEFADVYRRKASIYNDLAFQSFNPEDNAYHVRKGFEAIRQAMLLEPDNPANFILYSSFLRRSGDSVTAEVFARMALNELPNDAGAVAAVSLALSDQSKNPEERLELVRREHSLTPLGEESFIRRRERSALVDLGRVEEAVDRLQAELQITTEPQGLAADISVLQSTFLGQNLNALTTLINTRTRLEDNISDSLLVSWVNILAQVGLWDEVDKILPRASEQIVREDFSSARLYSEGRHAEARDRLEELINVYPDPAYLRFLAEHCMMLNDFDCAVDAIISISPRLESRNNKEPLLIDRIDFRLSLRLVASYRKIDESDAAERLLQAAFQFAESRNFNGDMSSLYVLPKLFLLAGDTAQAMELMRERIQLPDNDFVPFCAHCSFASPMWESLMGNNEFEQLVAEYERRKTITAERMEAMIEEAGY
jgi:TolB-like protein/tetratricopeptide (TPR) repeat protein